jgi:hypothetical protein
MVLGKHAGVKGMPPIKDQFVAAATVAVAGKQKSLPRTRAPSGRLLTTVWEPLREFPIDTGAVVIVDTGPKVGFEAFDIEVFDPFLLFLFFFFIFILFFFLLDFPVGIMDLYRRAIFIL